MENTRQWFNSNKKQFEYKLSNGCANCGDIAHHLHHIVPLAKGGTNNDSNIIQLCDVCHGIVHGMKWKGHSELTRRGLQKAKLNGKQIGAVQGKTLTTKKSVKAKEQIMKYNKDFGGSLNDTETIKQIGITRNTFYKYKKELITELQNEQ